MRDSIPFSLKQYINQLPILVHSAPQVMLLAIDLHEDLVDVEGIAVASMSRFAANRGNGVSSVTY
ncbi:MAG: hypothetical protein ACJARU_000137 [Congregibacter sp.]|jgi:hypothetical protein